MGEGKDYIYVSGAGEHHYHNKIQDRLSVTISINDVIARDNHVIILRIDKIIQSCDQVWWNQVN